MAYLHYISDHHCNNCKRNSDFSLLYATPITVRRPNQEGRRKWGESQDTFRGLFTCGYCRSPHMIQITKTKNQNYGGKGIFNNTLGGFLNRLNFLEVEIKGRSPSYSRVHQLNTQNYGIDLRGFMSIDNVYPSDEVDTPNSLPENIEDMYLELEEVKGSARYTLVACRKILETVCEHELDSVKGSLMKQIEQLKEEGKLPASIVDWAHTIRMLGNKAVHEDKKPSFDEANEIKGFVKTMLELLYTYPAKINELQKKT